MNVFQTECASESLGDIVKVEVARVGLGWSLRFYISSCKFPGNAHSDHRAEPFWIILDIIR